MSSKFDICKHDEEPGENCKLAHLNFEGINIFYLSSIQILANARHQLYIVHCWQVIGRLIVAVKTFKRSLVTTGLAHLSFVHWKLFSLLLKQFYFFLYHVEKGKILGDWFGENEFIPLLWWDMVRLFIFASSYNISQL